MHKQSLKKAISGVVAGLATLGATATYAAVTVTVTDLNGSFGASLFDTTTNTLSFNTPSFAVNTGNGVSINSLNALSPVLLDTLTIHVHSDTSLLSAKWTENGAVSRQGVALTQVAGSLAVPGSPADFVVLPASTNGFGDLPIAAWTATSTVGLSGNDVDITVTNVLFAASIADLIDPNKNQAFVAKTSALLEISATAVPLPAAAWMLGSSLIGLTAVGRRRKQNS